MKIVTVEKIEMNKNDMEVFENFRNLLQRIDDECTPNNEIESICIDIDDKMQELLDYIEENKE